MSARGEGPLDQSVRDAQGKLGQGQQGGEEQDRDAQGHAVARARARDGWAPAASRRNGSSALDAAP